jgi:hypothetical protein
MQVSKDANVLQSKKTATTTPAAFRLLCQRRNQDMSDQIAEGMIPYEVMEDGPK